MIKTFNSSDKKGTDGIDFGEDWYKRLISKLQTTSDCVCLFLSEAWTDHGFVRGGSREGQIDHAGDWHRTGVPLNRVATGPFYQFHNVDGSEGELIKLMNQLARRVQSLELDPDVVKAQVQAFKATEASILKTTATTGGRRSLPMMPKRARSPSWLKR